METYDNDYNPSCLSGDPHDDNIADPILHYFGCLEASERGSFFDRASPFWTREIGKLTICGISRSEAEAKVYEKLETWQNACSSEIHRLSLIYSALAKDIQQSHLLAHLASSRDTWRSSSEYKSNIQHVRNWRTEKNMQNGVAIEPLPVSTEELSPDDFPISIMAFEDGAAYDIQYPHVTGTFPNQTITVNNLLRAGPKETHGLLKSIKDRRTAGVTWFHIPSNNMTWVEEAIACYYGEKRPDRNQMRYGDESSQAARLLQESFWRGQQYGDAAKPRSRFMRPFCDLITPSRFLTWFAEGKKKLITYVDRSPIEPRSDNIVLFAPFLHWETSRQLTLFTRKIEKSLAASANRRRRKAFLDRQERGNRRRGLHTRAASYLIRLERGDSEIQQRQSFRLGLSAFPDVYRILVGPRGKYYRSKHPLGQYLLHAARLYEELHNYQDSSLIQKYLFSDPPLHPRRTLDQGYHTTVQTTRPRDRNQVVYRATTTPESSYHQFDHTKGQWTCPVYDHAVEECAKCRENIRRLSRMVMVDQLWMWVLDQKTIITCFPKRYGLHGRDPSGVFEAIQERLDRGRSVHSVFEIAYTILDECSNTFFDRMKDTSSQPQVLDIFSEAIRNVSRQQALESQRLWNWIDRARAITRQQGRHRNLIIPAWTTSTEGGLERDIQDIVEELEIMISVNKTQSDLYMKFIHYASKAMNGNKTPGIGIDASHPVGLDSSEVQLGAATLMAKVKDRVGYLESLLKTASSAAELVKSLSQLRQQQDSVIQALQSIKLSLDSIDQGRTLMVFTVITIIFSPLSFLSSIFGMNNQEFGQDQWKISDQFKYIFSISIGVTVFALIFASRHVRSAAVYTVAGIRHLFLTVSRVMRYIESYIFDRLSWIIGVGRKRPESPSAGAPLSPEV
ncbi:hypothetical protein O1611_g8945 [Lasiodiplodia mahajangana]|uniref:Uncharacterized protein n=1 Tax=Lasiodiplodia mahajangana TaxID=1108764 RepID=A0ACC2JB71_9PEZI|nr:hypothetical protein O1611_g8945 [Lasiodiplodia mahajangana]